MARFYFYTERITTRNLIACRDNTPALALFSFFLKAIWNTPGDTPIIAFRVPPFLPNENGISFWRRNVERKKEERGHGACAKE
jgi:hypothetical protein